MADDFDPEAMTERFRERARSVENHNLPFQDHAMIGDAAATPEGGVLILRIDLRPST